MKHASRKASDLRTGTPRTARRTAADRRRAKASSRSSPSPDGASGSDFGLSNDSKIRLYELYMGINWTGFQWDLRSKSPDLMRECFAAYRSRPSTYCMLYLRVLPVLPAVFTCLTFFDQPYSVKAALPH